MYVTPGGARTERLAAAEGRRPADLGFGRIVASEIEAPIILVKLV